MLPPHQPLGQPLPVQALCQAVWPDHEGPPAKLRSTIAQWLSTSPYPELGPRHALVTSLGHYLSMSPLAGQWLTAVYQWPKLKAFLLQPESYGIFMVGARVVDGKEVVWLDDAALQRAAATLLAGAGAAAGTQLGQPAGLYLPAGLADYLRRPGGAALAQQPLQQQQPLWQQPHMAWPGELGVVPAGQLGQPQVVRRVGPTLGLTVPGMAAGSGFSSFRLHQGGGLAYGGLLGGLGGHVEVEQDAGVPQAIKDAVAAAWPGATALARLKRRAAMALVAARGGPEGPHTMLASALGDVLHRHEAEAVAELRHPVTRTLRVKQLLHEGEDDVDAPGSLLPTPIMVGMGAMAPLGMGAAAAAAAAAPGLGGEAGSAAGGGAPGFGSGGVGGTDPTAAPGEMGSSASAGGVGRPGHPGLLRVIKGQFDIVVSLDMAGLLQRFGSGSAQQGPLPGEPGRSSDPQQYQRQSVTSDASSTAPNAAAAAAAALSAAATGAAAGGSFLMQQQRQLDAGASAGEAAAAAAAAAAGDASFLHPPLAQHQREGRLRTSGSTASSSTTRSLDSPLGTPPLHSMLSGGGSGILETGGSCVSGPTGHGQHGDGGSGGMLSSNPPSAGLLPGMTGGMGSESISELALRAFPGASPMARLRRAIVNHLAGLANRSLAWPHLGALVSSTKAYSTWLNPGQLRSFVLDASSQGVFVEVLSALGGPSSLVTLDLTVLRRAADVGLTAAIASTWPGDSPLDRIRRCAAFTLSSASRGPAGPYCMLGSALGTAIRKRDKEAFDALAGMGKLSELLDDGRGGGGQDGLAGPALGGAGAGGGGGGGGYFVCFKRDQDGYVRLRLEQLLQECPRWDPTGGSSSTTTVLGSGTAATGASAAGLGAPAATGGWGVGGEGGGAGMGMGALGEGTLSAPSATIMSLTAQQAAAIGANPGLIPQLDAGGLGGAGPSPAAGLYGGSVGSNPALERELLQRFPPPPGALMGSDAANIAAAKRCIARLLAWAPPPHQLTFAKLGAQVPKLLGGVRISRNLRLVCLEEPEVFAVLSQSPTVHVVRLVCPRLLQLAHEAEERRRLQQLQMVQLQQMMPAGSVGGMDEPRLLMQQQEFMQLAGGAGDGASLGGLVAFPPGQQKQQQLVTVLGLPQQQSQQVLLPAVVHHRGGPVTVIQGLGSMGGGQGGAGGQSFQQASMQGGVVLAGGGGAGGGLAGWQTQAGTDGASASAKQQQQQQTVANIVQQQLRALSQQQQQQGAPAGMSGAGGQGLLQTSGPSGNLGSLVGGSGGASGPIGGASSISSRGTNDAQQLPDGMQAVQVLQAGGGTLPATSVHYIADPYSSDFLAALQHCYSCSQLGISVVSAGGQPVLAVLYAPVASPGPVDPMLGVGAEGWPASVYLLELNPSAVAVASAGGAGGGGVGGAGDVAMGALLGGLKGLLEDPGVAKVAHGCSQLRPLELLTDALIAPLLDTRVLLDAITSMLPPLPPPLPPAHILAAAASNAAQQQAAGGGGAGGSLNATEAAAMSQLQGHLGALRGALQGLELWADRPEVLEALVERHLAAHRAELWAVTGRDSAWLSRPLMEAQAALAAQAPRHLPELWSALCEAVPWVAAHTALRSMQHLRTA